MKFRAIFFLFIFSPFFANAENLDLYQSDKFNKNGEILPYRILYPQNFKTHQKYSLLIVLHGAGERGNDNHLQLTHGASLFVEDNVRNKFPAIIVFPQCPTDSYWSNVTIEQEDQKRNFVFHNGGRPTQAMSLLLDLIDDLSQRSYVDQHRIYIGGLSMGGMGTFEVLARKPKLFAAAFVICGGGHPDTVKVYAKNVPIWVFHGAKDDVVPLSLSEIMVKALMEAGAKPKVTIYDDVEHESWTPAFAEPELLPWLFSQRRS